jgi:erythronate-4-phosphate dehydrogenase
MKRWRLVADENIPFAREVFGTLGEVVTLPGRTLTRADLVAADALLVRSVTRVDGSLLVETPVTFVGTCTIGIDHLDTQWFDQNGIAWASAPGCNANSVVQYALAAMARLRPHWLSQTVGIIGCGNVGGHLHRVLRGLGVAVKCYDPWLTLSQNPDLTTLDELLSCDIICVHTPLITTGAHPTLHLLNAERLAALRPGALLISAGRGAAIDNHALKALLPHRQDLDVVLDVWEPEPLLDVELLRRVTLGTPHIAGYSYDGKINGTLQIYHKLCQHLGVSPTLQADTLLTDDVSSQQVL